MLHIFRIKVAIHYKCVVRFDFNETIGSITDTDIIFVPVVMKISHNV